MASFQSTEKCAVNGFSLGRNVQMWPMGKTKILCSFLTFSSGSLKPFSALSIQRAGTHSTPKEKVGPTQGIAAEELKLLSNWALVCES